MKTSKASHLNQRKLLERKIQPLLGLRDDRVPPSGWLKAIRGALGISTRQLAARLGIEHAAIIQLEKRETEGKVIAATNRELEEEIRRGNFRSDLFYRLNVIALNLPPLRDRRDDLLLLLEAFLQAMAQESGGDPKALSSDALDAVAVYEWPGNVRELENALEHAVVLSRGNLIEAAALPERITKRRKEPLVAERSYRNPTLEVIERAYIMWVLQAEGGNKTRAAEVLGIDPSTLYRKLSRYEEQVEVKA
jgi:two-component system response regulator HydG